MLERFRLDGRVAVVTGGSRGIGRAIALALAEAGADLAVASRDGARSEGVAAEARAHGRRAVAVGCDVASERDLDALFARVRDDLGGCDVLVACAGLSSASPARDATREDLQQMLDVHYFGGVVAAQRAAAQMRARGRGSILLVTSVWGLGGQPGQLAYGGAKAALAQAVRVLALEWARDGIRVNGLAPGLVETDMTSVLTPAIRDKLVSRVPMRRAAMPEEMAGAALFLCSDAASYVTGQILVADGGERAR